MPNIASALKAEIQRIARKTIRDETSSLKRTIAPYRSEIAALKRRTQVLEQQLRRSRKAVSRVAAPRREEEQEPSGIRFRLGLSAADFGTLIGASGQSVYKWEEGKSRPRQKNLTAIAAIRSIGKKEALARLQQAA
jgi:DNA-binding transcriptional regulator YiaG